MSKSAQVPLHTWLPDRYKVSAIKISTVTKIGEKHSLIRSSDNNSFKMTIWQ